MSGREIKFRVWDKECKHTRGWDWVRLCHSPFSSDPEGTHLLDGKIFEIMQYTGLKDKNGKEIYEGDILNNTDSYAPYKCVVEWNTEDVGSCGCCYQAFSGVGFIGRIIGKTEYTYSKYSECFSKMEVIGNIYENPELL